MFTNRELRKLINEMKQQYQRDIIRLQNNDFYNYSPEARLQGLKSFEHELFCRTYWARLTTFLKYDIGYKILRPIKHRIMYKVMPNIPFYSKYRRNKAERIAKELLGATIINKEDLRWD